MAEIRIQAESDSRCTWLAEEILELSAESDSASLSGVSIEVEQVVEFLAYAESDSSASVVVTIFYAIVTEYPISLSSDTSGYALVRHLTPFIGEGLNARALVTISLTNDVPASGIERFTIGTTGPIG